MAYLKVFGEQGERTVFLADSAVVLGRGEDADILLKDIKVSRLHCVVEPTGDGRWRVRDLDSGNGICVNGDTMRESVLRPDDVITVGDVRVLFAGEAAQVVGRHAPASPADAPPSPAPPPPRERRRGAESRPGGGRA
ncbi:MAG: FHA domain-containing protein, partial [Planctomycetota bacterium]